MAGEKQPRKARKRRQRGTGTIFFNQRRDCYVGRVPVGRKPDGSTLYVEVSDPREGGCIEKMKAAKPVRSGSVTVAEWSGRWLASIRGKAPLYQEICRRSVEQRINPVLGAFPLSEVTAYHVELAIQQWAGQLAPNTVLMTTRHLGSLMASAVRAEIISRNPVSAARRPRAVRKRIDPFTPAELGKIIRAASQNPRWRCAALLAATGLRVGELVALDATDYDPATGLLSISKGERLHHGIGPPKTYNSIRTIRVPDAAQPVLAAARGGRGRGPLFIRDGKRQSRFSAVKAWRRVLEACGLAYRTPHVARHSVASQMLAAGASPADVAAYLGDMVETIFKTYIHPTRTDASRVMDGLLMPERARKRG